MNEPIHPGQLRQHVKSPEFTYFIIAVCKNSPHPGYDVFCTMRYSNGELTNWFKENWLDETMVIA